AGTPSFVCRNAPSIRTKDVDSLLGDWTAWRGDRCRASRSLVDGHRMSKTTESAIIEKDAASSIAISPRIAELLSEASASVEQHLFADNTKKAYASDWRVFQEWCDEYKVYSLPAHPTTLIAFFTDIKH